MPLWAGGACALVISTESLASALMGKGECDGLDVEIWALAAGVKHLIRPRLTDHSIPLSSRDRSILQAVTTREARVRRLGK